MLMFFYNKSVTATLKELSTTPQGLSNKDAEARLNSYGSNSINVTGDPLWRKLIEPFANVFTLILGVAIIISLIHGDTLDAIIVGAIIIISAVIYYVQRFSTERILRALKKQSIQHVSVIREGASQTISATNLVPGDIIVLHEGEKVPADARITQAASVRTDESLLTGESEPVSKHEAALSGEKQLYERSNTIFQGSFIVSGTLRAVVTKTGNATEFGQIAALSKNTEARSPVEKKIDKLINQIIAVVAAVSVLAFALAVYRGTDILEAIRFVMALAVSAVPESLPVAISIVLVLGMRRMAARKALVRNMRAIETIGVITTIATDKTGTLTHNRLSIHDTWRHNITGPAFTQLLAESIITSDTGAMHDPLDDALQRFTVAQESYTASSLVATKVLPFDQDYAFSGNIWEGDKDGFRLTIKGAPEAIMAHASLTEEEREAAEQQLHTLTAKGYRVIAFASASLSEPIASFAKLPQRTRFDFAGFVAIADTLRTEAKQAIAAATKAGVTVRMITGDHLETAYHIGKKLGMVTKRDQVFDSRRMTTMSDDELDKAIRDVRIFSRVIPENKHRLLTVLKRHNITAMTGDGVNDVPALSNAHVGLAMGSGTQIAQEAGDIILLDDNFKSVVDAMREGRTIISNIRRMLYYLLATNAGEALTILGAMIVGLPVPLAPVQILWVNLVTDTSMAIPLGLEKGEKHTMEQPPEKPTAPILSRTIIVRMILVALSMAIVTLVLYALFSAKYGADYGRTIAFCALVVIQWSNAFNARSDYESIFRRIFVWNTAFYVGLVVSIGLQLLAIFGPLQSLLHITPVAIGDLVTTGAIAFIVPIIVVELHKWWCRRADNKLVHA